MDQVFPEYRGVFKDIYSVEARLTLTEFSSPDENLRVSLKKISDKLSGLCISRTIS